MKPSSVYVISDLHLGGDPDAPVPGGRGFRMCQQGALLATFIEAIARKDRKTAASELVIAGDFVDFLAERPERSHAWQPFYRDPDQAREIFATVANKREPAVFDALADLVDRGHRLVVLLGNHDLELSLPAVRSSLLERIGAGRGRLADVDFVYDNEAYVLENDVIIEHGNQADAMNRVKFDELRRLRSRQSRRTDSPRVEEFDPPHGSKLVAELMNDVKAELPFVDLLKPEASGAFLVLVALKPKLLLKLPRLLRTLGAGAATAVHDAASPRLTTEIARSMATGGQSADPIELLVRTALEPPHAQEMLELLALRHVGLTSDVAKATASELWRAMTLLRTFFDEDGCFDPNAEAGRPYERAARAHVSAGFDLVVFGHTHRPVDTTLTVNERSGRYLNTGTWADRIRLPQALRTALAAGDEPTIRSELDQFLSLVKSSDLEPLVTREPTFARIELGDDGVRSASVRVYAGGDPDQSPPLVREG